MKTEQEVIEVLREQDECDGETWFDFPDGATRTYPVPLAEFLPSYIDWWVNDAVELNKLAPDTPHPFEENREVYVRRYEEALAGLPGGLESWEVLATGICPLWLAHYTKHHPNMAECFGLTVFKTKGAMSASILSSHKIDGEDRVFLVPTVRPEFMVLNDSTDPEANILVWLHRVKV